MTPTGCLASLSALPVGAQFPVGAVRYASRGAVLVAGDDASVLAPARELARTLRVVVFAPGAEGGDPRDNPAVVGARVTALEGRLGAFRAKARTEAGERDIGTFGPNPDGTFDLVLDLQTAPLLRRSVPPFGYFAPTPGALDEALAALRALVGTFAKPKFFDYDEGLCAHGAQGYAGCTRCLAACGAGAIRSAGDRIAVDPHLCQGCAACTLACPTGALSFAHPSRAELRARLASALASARDTGRSPLVIVHPPAQAAAVAAIADGADCVALESSPVAAFGEELWFAALAGAARGVALVPEAGVPPETGELLAARVCLARAMLGAAGIDEDAVRLVMVDALDELVRKAPASRPPAPAAPLPVGPKRAMLAEALRRIEPGAGFASVALGPGAPLGAVTVDRANCTLCSACANLCPTGALAYRIDRQAILAFQEEACVQCGICAAACPERAIALVPRAAPSGERRTARVVCEDDEARCPRCGKAFMPERLLAASIAKVAARMTLTAAAEERMRWCPECRQQ